MNDVGALKLQRQGRAILLLILMLFTLPILIVLAMYYFSLHPVGSSHGNLLTPPRPLHFPPITTWDNKQFSEKDMLEKWSLLYVAPANCNQPCTTQLHTLRQIHAALGKEMSRAQRIMLVTGAINIAQLNAIQHDYPDMAILVKPAQTVVQLIDQLSLDQKTGFGLFVVDPLGNAMMYYPPTTDPNGIRKDITHLLKYSWTG